MATTPSFAAQPFEPQSSKGKSPVLSGIVGMLLDDGKSE